MKISKCASKLDPKCTQSEISDLHALSSPARKDSAPLWSPCTFADDSRLEAKAVEVSALVLDFDGDRPSTPLKQLNVTHSWHTTASHTANTPRWRLIVELDAPVAAEDWADFWPAAVHALGLESCDTSCKNVGRFYYVPPTNAQWEEHKGRPVPTAEIATQTKTDDLSKLRRALLAAKRPEYISVIRQALASRPIANEGARDATVTGWGFYLGRSVVPHGTSIEALLQLVGGGLALPGPQSRDYWVKKFTEAYARGTEKRNARTEADTKELGLDAPWAKQLQTATRMDGSVAVLSNNYNAKVILLNCGLYLFRHNLLEDSLEIAKNGEEFRPLTDPDTTDISNWLQQTFRVGISRQLVYDQIASIAKPFDPLREYLDGLEWDGVNRIDSFLQEYLGVEDTPQARLYSRKWLIAVVARALQPGCKMDNVLVLQGAQGLGKSTGLRLMAEPWFSDSKVVVGDKDSLLSASRFWVHEFAELASLRRADLETIKAFFTSTTDAYRPPYGRAMVTRPRRCIFVATTNEVEFLQDETGLRRFWVVSCVSKVDFAKVSADRGFILAEAKEAFLKGEHWWLETEEEVSLQSDSASNYSVSGVDNARAQSIIQWWEARPIAARPAHLTTAQVVLDIWNVPLERAGLSHNHEAARCLRALQWTRFTPSEGGRRIRAYKPPVSWEGLPQRNGGQVVDFKAIG